MARKRAVNQGGRPKEYAEDLRTISLSLPKTLLQRIDMVAEQAGMSRQRLIIEWLKMSSLLKTVGFLRSSSVGTIFDQFPIVQESEGGLFTSMTNKQLANYAAKIATQDPDAPVRGMAFLVTRDQENDVEQMLKSLGASTAKLASKKNGSARP